MLPLRENLTAIGLAYAAAGPLWAPPAPRSKHAEARKQRAAAKRRKVRR